MTLLILGNALRDFARQNESVADVLCKGATTRRAPRMLNILASNKIQRPAQEMPTQLHKPDQPFGVIRMVVGQEYRIQIIRR